MEAEFMTRIVLNVDACEASDRAPTVLQINGVEIAVNVFHIPEDRTNEITALRLQVSECLDELTIVREKNEALCRENASLTAAVAVPQSRIHDALRELATWGNPPRAYKIGCIKLVRMLTDLSLKGAKEIVDRYL